MKLRSIQIITLLGCIIGYCSESYSQGLAEGKDKFLGCAHSYAQLSNFEQYWNQVTPENGSKWGSVERTRDNMNWSELDAAYNFADDNGFLFRFHVLIWGNQQPSWIETLPPEEQLEEIEEWMSEVSWRYPDMHYLEVVNEPLHDPPNQPGSGGGNYIEALGGSGTTGWDWVLNAFRMARDYFPDVKLMLNDYGIVNSTTDAGRYIKIIELLQAEDLIDGIGVQGHAFNTRGSTTTMKNNLDRLAATGLPIQVTEFDIDGPTDEVQLEDYQRIFPTFWEHPAVEGITLWGWRPGCWRTPQGAYLVQSNGEERPALEWLREYLSETDIEESTIQVPEKYALLQNYPNPFNPSTTIGFSIHEKGPISLIVFDLLGHEIEKLIDNEETNPGHYQVSFDGNEYPGGIYFYRLIIEDHYEAKKMILLK